MTIEQLGLPQIVNKFADYPRGLVIVTGPTGSGKSSTLYAALKHKHDGTNTIITIEDPVEYKIPGITQIQGNYKVEFGFEEGLRSVLRQDTDFMMVGEFSEG